MAVAMAVAMVVGMEAAMASAVMVLAAMASPMADMVSATAMDLGITMGISPMFPGLVTDPTRTVLGIGIATVIPGTPATVTTTHTTIIAAIIRDVSGQA